VSGDWARTIFGTRDRPRYGSGISIGILVVIGALLALAGSWVLGIVFWALAAGAAFVRGVRRST
jgi:hypothetical protein